MNNKEPVMKKTLNTLIAVFLTSTMAMVANGQDASQSTKPWNGLKHIQTEADYVALPENATIAMSCSKCKAMTVILKRDITTKPGHGTVEEALTIVQCPGCGGKMVTELKQTKFVHTCSKCGSGSAFCCATSPGEKTPGM
jgi:hypothetical protein